MGSRSRSQDARPVSARSSLRGVTILVAVFLVVISVLVGLAAVGLEVLTSVRAYVGGEVLWSKAEKDASSALSRYIVGGDEAYYDEFRRQLAVPLGDRRAREELSRPEPDLSIARAGFLQGRNHPADVDWMSRLFIRFRRFAPLDRAIAIWQRGDALIAQLAKIGDDVHSRASTGPLTEAERQGFLREVELINGRATILEDAFSATLGEAARWVRDALQKAILAMTILLVGVALVASVRIGTFLHIQEDLLRAAEEKSRFQASHDVLTRLPNRLLFSDRLSLAILRAQRHRERLAVMFLDLDNFKKINDGLGHSAGDDVLVQVAERLRSCLRGNDTVARLGGDEFIFLLSDVSKESDVASLARKILALVSESLAVSGQEVRVTASLGVGIYPHDGADADTLIANVDAAMYRAKELGRNNFQFVTKLDGESGSSR
jgi:diguanylate cyclase (GGDEF)-like protein